MSDPIPESPDPIPVPTKAGARRSPARMVAYGLLALTLAASLYGISYYTNQLAHATELSNKRINLAGRQRALSQRMTKALLLYDRDAKAGQTGEAPIGELKKVSGAFNAVITGFDHPSSRLIGVTNAPKAYSRTPYDAIVVRPSVEMSAHP